MRRTSLAGCLAWLLATGAALAAPPDATPAEIEAAVQRLSGARSLWPGFQPLSVPLAVHGGGETWLFRHPSPPAGFAAAGAGSAGLVWPGRHPDVTANTSTVLGGVPTATLAVDASQASRSAGELAAVAIHEAFHVFQRARHPGWSGNEADLFTWPAGDAQLLALRRLESLALARALAAADPADSAAWAARALGLRASRHAGMDARYGAYERLTELNEGLASYVERLAGDSGPPVFPSAGFRAAAVRERTYVTGPALALLLDRHAPGWQDRLEADDGQSLEGLLAAAVGVHGTGAGVHGADGTEGASGAAGRFSAAESAAAQAAAREDVAALAVERLARRAAFESLPGWRLVVETAPGAPLQLRGFDPLNVQLVDEGVLHGRFLRLGHDACELQALDDGPADVEVLTEAAGGHPLFDGVRRVTIAGLSAEPGIALQDDVLTARAPGLSLRFRGASAEVSGRTVIVRGTPPP